MPTILYSFPPLRLECCIGGLLKRFNLAPKKKKESSADMFVMMTSIALYVRKKSTIIVIGSVWIELIVTETEN